MNTDNAARLEEIGRTAYDQWWYDYYAGMFFVGHLFADGRHVSGMSGASFESALTSTDDPGWSDYPVQIGWVVSEITKQGLKPVACSAWDTPEVHVQRDVLIGQYWRDLRAACNRVLSANGHEKTGA